MAGDFAVGLGVIVHTPQIISIRHGRKGAVERKNFKAVARKIEVANDFRPQQRDDIRADGEFKSRENFFCDCRPAEHMTPL